ncbi:ANTAR domain-containing protein [Knoellia sp. CPCC 206435]|uniref:ANTAR domain-containing protein n=1 Tax=Knoellia terrae TaxID=3404797 RepID=UPI003B429100
MTHLRAIVERLSGSDHVVSPGQVIRLATLALPRAEHVGLSLIRAGRKSVIVDVSDDTLREMDALQHQCREGPLLDGSTGPSVLLSHDVSTDDRWPTFGPRCTEGTRVRSVLSIRLPVGGDDHAAMSFSSSGQGAFTDEDVTAASVVVPLAALSIEAELRQRDRDNLTKALGSSRHISTAVGIIMAVKHVSDDDAFALLRQASMDLNERLYDVAARSTSPGHRRAGAG